MAKIVVSGHSDDCWGFSVVGDRRFGSEPDSPLRFSLTLPSGESITGELEFDGSWKTTLDVPDGTVVAEMRHQHGRVDEDTNRWVDIPEDEQWSTVACGAVGAAVGGLT